MPLRSRSGMTLLELLVGLTITGMALAAGYGALATTLDQRERMVRATAGVEASARVRRTLVSWIAGARLEPDASGPEFQGIDAEEGAWPDDELTFLTSASTPLGPARTVVRLSIDRDERTPERGLVADLQEWRGPRAQRVELVPHARGLQVRFLSGTHREQSWIDSWISTSILPAGLDLRLQAEEPDSVAPLLRLPVVVPLGGAR
jgi:prepilin-type N-terminal cleavage/methylation domain-containing protein